MRALVCSGLGAVDNLEVGELPDPEPGPNEVAVDVHAAGLNFPDTLIIQGLYQYQPELPFVPGAEAAGVVASVGEAVEHVAVGDRVTAMAITGAFAERWVVPESAVVPIPDQVDFVTAAGLRFTYGTSYYALKQRAELRAGESLLVLGAAGGVGSAAVELGVAMGASVIAAASTDEKLALASDLGAIHLVNYSGDSLRDEVKALTAGAGADIVYDPVGGELSEQAFRATAWGGRFLVIGFASGDIPRIPLNLPLLKGASLVGVFWGSWLQRDPTAARENDRELMEMLRQGTIEPRISSTHDLEDYAAAFGELSRRRALGKVVFQLR